MTGATKSPALVDAKYTVYTQFQGMDRSRDITAMDTNSNQHLWTLKNCHADWRGRIVREAPVQRRNADDNAVVQTLKFYSRENVCWSQEGDGGVSLNSDRNHLLDNVYPVGSKVSITNFNGTAIATVANQQSYKYQGSTWSVVGGTAPKAAYACTVRNRLAAAGMIDRPTEVWFSRVRNVDVWHKDETPTGTEVTKAFYIDIRSLIGTADEITGLGQFETNRLAIFTNESTLIYKVDEDYSKVAIDENANIRVGCISHRTICQSMNNLLFCSRYGIHMISRSDVNGVYIAHRIISDKIEPYYKDLVRSMDDKTAINACYDPDLQQYHVYFPKGRVSKRLTLTLRHIGTKAEVINWSIGTSLNQRCADALGGQFVLGTYDGLFNQLERSIEYGGAAMSNADIRYSEMEIETPILWCGTAIDYKESRSLMVQATGYDTTASEGAGSLVIEVFDEQGRPLRELSAQIEGKDDGVFPDSLLSRSYELPMNLRFRGLQIRIRSASDGPIVILGLSISLKRGA